MPRIIQQFNAVCAPRSFSTMIKDKALFQKWHWIDGWNQLVTAESRLMMNFTKTFNDFFLSSSSFSRVAGAKDVST